MINFPASPTVGQLYPSPAVAGQPVYRWDGEKWTTQGAFPSLFVSDTPPASAPDNSLWWESDTGNLYIKYNDGDSSQWVAVNPLPDLSQSVSYALQTPSLAQQIQARQNIMAAPIEALADANLVVNGSMQVAQQYGVNSGVAGAGNTSLYTADQWLTQMNGGGAGTWAVGNPLPALPGYTHYLQLQSTTASASPAAGDFYVIQQWIEGLRAARLQWGTANAVPTTIGFWVQSSVAGVYGFICRDNLTQSGVNGQNFVTTYTINNPNTWEWKTITIPACTGGAGWSQGMWITFSMAAGSTYLKAAGAGWQNITAALGVTGAVNFMSATGRSFMVTGVCMLPGTDFPTVDKAPLLMRSYDKELALCFRYFQFYANATWSVYGGAGNQMQVMFTFSPMMKVPAINFLAPSYGNGNSGAPSGATICSVCIIWVCPTAGQSAFITGGMTLSARGP